MSQFAVDVFTAGGYDSPRVNIAYDSPRVSQFNYAHTVEAVLYHSSRV